MVKGNMVTRWAKEVSPTNALPEYPRPMMRRERWTNLNGLWAFLDITAFKGKVAILKVNGVTQEGMVMIVQSNEIPGAGDFYSETLRPQFQFSQKIGWNNDGNGMVYYDGEWHLYFQHNPYGWNWGNMHWGHVVSKDLVHWEQLPIAIYNKKRGIFRYLNPYG